MGLLDRFKKDPGPDALTWEAVARARATPGVAGAEPVDADTVTVTWTEHPGATTLSLAEVRDAWTKATGFDRIELMDQVVAGLAPPPAGATVSAPQPEPSEPSEPPTAGSPAAAPAMPAPATDAWLSDRAGLGVAIGRPGATGAVRWPVGQGALEATATIDGRPVAAADVERWGVTADDVRSAAVEGLLGLDPALDPIAPGQPAWVPTTPADHPPAWLAAPARLLAATGLPTAVVLAPTATELVVVDPEAHDLLGSVLSGTKSIVAEAAEVLLAAPLLVTADGLAEWVPPDDHPCASLVADLRRS